MFKAGVRTLCLWRRGPSIFRKVSQYKHSESWFSLSKMIPENRKTFCSAVGIERREIVEDDVDVSPFYEKLSKIFVPFSEDLINQLASDDPDKMKHVKLINFEYEVGKQEGSEVPDGLTMENWKELFVLPSHHQRKKYLYFLYRKQTMKLKEYRAKQKSKVKRESSLAALRESRDNETHINYGIFFNTIHLRIRDSTIEDFNNGRLIKSAIFEKPLIYDLSFHQNMNAKEQKLTVAQLIYVLALVREHREPVPLVFTNADRNSVLMQHLEKTIPTIHEPDFPITVTEKSYLDLYPREQLVYLTPHCKETLTHYDRDVIHIVGALVDKGPMEPLTLAKAKREGIRMAQLPLDHYLKWRKHRKSLTINSMAGILLDLRLHGNWMEALSKNIGSSFYDDPQGFSNTPSSHSYKREKFSYQNRNHDKRDYQERRPKSNDLLFNDLGPPPRGFTKKIEKTPSFQVKDVFEK